MTNKLIIDTTTDVFATYGVYMTEGAYKEVVSWPALKSLEKNDWQEYNAIEVDCSAPKISNRTFSIPFACNGGVAMHDTFMAFLYAASHQYTLVELSKTFPLRVIGEKDLKLCGDLLTFKVEFAEDIPLNDYTYDAPSSSLPVDNRYKLDTIPFSQYGVRFLQGTKAEIVKQPGVKENLVRNISTIDGVLSNPMPVKMKSRDIKLICLMTASSVSEFWHNWYALLYDLCWANPRTLQYESVGNISCVYKACTISHFALYDGKVWCEFNLSVTTINN